MKQRYVKGDRVYVISMDQAYGTFVRYTRREGYGLGELAEVDIDNHLSNVLVPVRLLRPTRYLHRTLTTRHGADTLCP